PAPKVMSSIVRMAPLPKDQLGAQDETLLGKIVTAAFGQRRKTLKNTLRDYMGDADFAALGIDPSLRGEKLSVEQFVAIANHCSVRG
ncbi:rRNA adenine N-6-methyltransferase family protein, partial [Thauera propionica]|uniref:rRNA adenine N-6-methyltransferase family protein n=1 Tax=Thauera propionica TaxID=2019431 RepID=UPI0023F58C5D